MRKGHKAFLVFCADTLMTVLRPEAADRPRAACRPCPMPRPFVRRPPAYSAASTRVLSAEYSSALRKARFGIPQGIRPAFRGHIAGNVDAVPARNARFRDKKRAGETILRAPHGKTIAWCRRDKIRTYFCRWDRCGDFFGTLPADNVLLTLGLGMAKMATRG